MDRRRFLVTSLAGALGAPLAVGAQAVKIARVGLLAPDGGLTPRHEAFRAALRGLGWVEGQNLVIEYRFGGEDYERLRALAADLVRLKVDVIFAATAPSAQAAKEATASIPIVFHTLNDPVRGGLVASFGRPGGNLTGNAGLGPELDRKRVELLKELVPSLSRATVLVNPTTLMTEASDAKGLDEAFQAMPRPTPAGLIVFEDPLFSVNRLRIIEFASRQARPHGLHSIGLGGGGGPHRVRPEPTPDAKALGLTIPQSLRLRADQVIE